MLGRNRQVPPETRKTWVGSASDECRLPKRTRIEWTNCPGTYVRGYVYPAAARLYSRYIESRCLMQVVIQKSKRHGENRAFWSNSMS